MADKVTTYNNLKLIAGFVDEDSRTITVPNPNTAIDLATAINNLNTLAANVLIGDKYAAQFSRFQHAEIVQGVTRELDLTN